MANCKYITKNGRCGLKGSYTYRHGCFGEDMCKCREPLTNADRIRSMSDEELAVWLVGATVCERVCDEDEYCHGNECVKRVTRWLKQPAKEELT